MLQVDGKKMSKSLGNFFTVRDLLEQGVPGEVIRFVYLSTHYRQPMDWTRAKAVQAEATLRKWREAIAGIVPAAGPSSSVLSALADDLNTASAIEELHRSMEEGNFATLKASAILLGLLEDDMGSWLDESVQIRKLLKQHVDEFVRWRTHFRQQEKFVWADKIRDQLVMNSIKLMDAKDGSTGFEIDDFKLLMNYRLENEPPVSGKMQIWRHDDRPLESQLIGHLTAKLGPLLQELETRFGGI